MSTPIHDAGPFYPGEDQFTEADFSGFAELFTEDGATVTCTIEAGSGITLTGSPAWDHTTKRAQQRIDVDDVDQETPVLLKWSLLTSPNALDRIGYTRLILEPPPSA